MFVDGGARRCRAEREGVAMALGVNSDELRKQSAQLKDFANERAQHESRVTEIAADLADDWTGETGAAIQKALENYLTQAGDVRREEAEIADKIDASASMYDQSDTQASSSLTSQMNI
jgi:uncharacterized protein YukE